MITSVKVKKKKTTHAAKPVQLYLQVICRRNVRRISLPYRLTDGEWNPVKEAVVIPEGTAPERASLLVQTERALRQHKEQLQEIIAYLQKNGELSAQRIVQEYADRNRSIGWLEYMNAIIDEKHKERAEATLRNWRSTYRTFQQFLKGMDIPDIPVKEVDYALLKRFERYLFAGGLTANTVSFHCRVLRMVWNCARAQGIIESQASPFINLCTRIEKTPKRAVDEPTIARLSALTFEEPGLTFARDLFLFCYYARGMSFVDLAYLTHENIKGNTLIYTRKKTGQLFRVELLPVMKQLLRRYDCKDSRYLFPILKSDTPSLREYDSALRLQNKRLKRIGQEVGCNLSTYVARHSWASIAKKKGIPEEIISECMGHTSLKTTQIYLATLDYSRIDRANQIVVLGKVSPRTRVSGVP